VFDEKTGELLSDVNIIIVGTTLSVDSRKDGSYRIINVPPGIYELQARGIGYLPLTVKDVIVEMDHSTLLNLKLFPPRTIKAREVTVEAEKEKINMDIPSNRYYSTAREINEIPLVSSLEDYLSFLWGIPKRGKEEVASQIVFVTDGFSLSDDRTGISILTPPLSAVDQVVVLKGGFDVEYGNVQSGTINIIEKEGRRDSYHGSANFQYTFPHKSHHGNSIFSPHNFHIRPFVDTKDSLCWKGTSVLSDDEDDEYESFEGWIQYSEDRKSEGDTLLPEEWRELFMYVYRVEGSEVLGQIPGSEGEEPGYMIDFGFGGPFPGINKITFFVSHVKDVSPFSLPVTRENYIENKTDLKITFHLKPEVKLNIKGLFQTIQTVTADGREIYPSGRIWAESGDILDDVAGKDFMYWVDALNPYDIARYAWGLDFNHSLNPSVFYTLRLFYSRSRNLSTPIWKEDEYSENYRDTMDLIYFGNIGIPREVPFGYENFPGSDCYYRSLLPSDFVFSNYGRTQKDASWVNTINFNSEITSVINSYHQLKAGFQINHDLIYSYLSSRFQEVSGEVIEESKWEGSPLGWGAYIEDNVSNENLFAKLGLRVDYYNPDSVNSNLVLSPRLGVSCPLSKSDKIYLNFGYFYELPEPEKTLGEFYNYGDSTGYLGNPELDLPKTISYELGFERIFFDQYLMHISGFYSDYDNKIGEIDSVGNGFSYKTYTNNIDGDIKGSEFSLRKRYGKIFKGFLAYNYTVESHRKKDTVETSKDIVDSKPAFRLLLTFNTPQNWGRFLGNISSSILYTRTGGEYFSYDPLAPAPFSPENPDYINNLKWQDEAYWNLLLGKNLSFRGFHFSIYAEINNLFDSRYITNDRCFKDDTDKLRYFRSLRLPMYKEERYAVDPALIGGNDKPGEIGKDYIDKPAIEYLYYTNPRYLKLGVRVDF
jgi:outer membrane receptor protein involved in Fe transport